MFFGLVVYLVFIFIVIVFFFWILICVFCKCVVVCFYFVVNILFGFVYNVLEVGCGYGVYYVYFDVWVRNVWFGCDVFCILWFNVINKIGVLVGL